MDINATRKDNEKVFRTFGTIFVNDDVSFNVSVECGDLNILGSLSVDGNLTSRNIWLNDGNGDLEVNGNLTTHNSPGAICAKSVNILGNCSCISIKSHGLILIGGDCSCDSMISYNDDIIIDGNFTGNIDRIQPGENHHVYIAGNCVK